MNHAEVIFEPGSHSVVSYDDIEELKSFLAEHHRRALSGEPGAPQDWTPRTDIDPNTAAQADRHAERPAERVTKVLLYDRHPADFNPSKMVNVDKVKTLLDGMNKEGWADFDQLVPALRDEVSPVHPVDQGRHESIYRMPPTDELDLSFLTAETGYGTGSGDASV